MASTPLSANQFTDFDRDLIKKSEEAIEEGLVLRDWCLSHADTLATFPLDLQKKFQLPNRAVGYFGEIDLPKGRQSVMGCRQYGDFARLDSPNGPQLLQDFVLGEFLPRAHWTYPDGYPGGFTISRSLYQKGDGSYGKFPDTDSTGCVDWRDLGAVGSDAKYRWVLLTVQIHDFVMDFGPMVKRFQEAACVVMTPEFRSVRENPSPGVRLEVAVGYPFVAYAPIPNFFGFGPGKFGIAVKLYAFELLENGVVRSRMEFAAVPRCQKVFDFGRYVPDPIYGGAALFSMLTLGLWKPEIVHTKMDSNMLAQHSRVHQSLMDGSANVWKQWYGEVSGGHR